MPRVMAMVGVFAVVVGAIGWNISHYPIVWQMVATPGEGASDELLGDAASAQRESQKQSESLKHDESHKQPETPSADTAPARSLAVEWGEQNAATVVSDEPTEVAPTASVRAAERDAWDALRRPADASSEQESTWDADRPSYTEPPSYARPPSYDEPAIASAGSRYGADRGDTTGAVKGRRMVPIVEQPTTNAAPAYQLADRSPANRTDAWRGELDGFDSPAEAFGDAFGPRRVESTVSTPGPAPLLDETVVRLPPVDNRWPATRSEHGPAMGPSADYPSTGM